MRKFLLVLTLALLPSLAHAVSFVEDHDNRLRPADESMLAQQLAQISQDQNILIVARTIGALQGTEISERAYNVRRNLESDNPSVIVMIVSVIDHKAFIATSPAAKARISDLELNRVFTETMTPALRHGDILGAFLSSAHAINGAIRPMPVQTAPVQSAPIHVTPVQTTQPEHSFFGVFLVFFLLLGIGGIVMIMYAARQRRIERMLAAKNKAYHSTTDADEYPSVGSAYPTYRNRASDYVPPSRSTNIVAPVIINNETNNIANTPVQDHWLIPERRETPTQLYPDSGGGAGGSFDDSKVAPDNGGGAGGSFAQDDSASTASYSAPTPDPIPDTPSFDDGGGAGGSIDDGGGSSGDY